MKRRALLCAALSPWGRPPSAAGPDLSTVRITVRRWTAEDFVCFEERILPHIEPLPRPS